MRRSVCIDLDGTLAVHDKWIGLDHFGDPLPGAVEFTKELAKYADIIIFTCRCNPEMSDREASHLLVNRVKAWLDKHGFVYHQIWSGPGKPIASAYVDDCAVAIPTNVDWTDGTHDRIMKKVKMMCGIPYMPEVD